MLGGADPGSGHACIKTVTQRSEIPAEGGMCRKRRKTQQDDKDSVADHAGRMVDDNDVCENRLSLRHDDEGQPSFASASVRSVEAGAVRNHFGPEGGGAHH